MYRGMILAASGVLNDRPATTKHEVARNPAARGNALNYPRIDVRGMMLVDRGGKLVTGDRVSLCTDASLHLLAGMLGQHVTDETGHIVEYQRAWRANRDGFAPVLSNFRERFQIALTSGRAASSHPCRLDRAGATCTPPIQIAATCHTPAHN
jgi:hypothetical protein